MDYHRSMTKAQVYERIERQVAKAGSGRKWAASIGLDYSYAAKMRKGKLDLQPAFLDRIGIERVATFTYREKRPCYCRPATRG